MPAMVNLLSDKSKSTRDVTESSTDMILLLEALRRLLGLLKLVGVLDKPIIAALAVAFAPLTFLVELSCCCCYCALEGYSMDFSPPKSSLLFSLLV